LTLEQRLNRVYSLRGCERHNLVWCHFHLVLGRSRGRMQTVFPGVDLCICSGPARRWPVGKPSPPPPDHLHIADTGRAAAIPYLHYFVDLLRDLPTTASTILLAAFPLRFLGLGFGWRRLKGPPPVVDWLAEFFPPPSQPFILGFQLLIPAPEPRHLFGNSFLGHARLAGIVARKPNFVQPVSRR
jgi:hypothetical protein